MDPGLVCRSVVTAALENRPQRLKKRDKHTDLCYKLHFTLTVISQLTFIMSEAQQFYKKYGLIKEKPHQ
jgi:hypothetical protein